MDALEAKTEVEIQAERGTKVDLSLGQSLL